MITFIPRKQKENIQSVQLKTSLNYIEHKIASIAKLGRNPYFG